MTIWSEWEGSVGDDEPVADSSVVTQRFWAAALVVLMGLGLLYGWRNQPDDLQRSIWSGDVEYVGGGSVCTKKPKPIEWRPGSYFTPAAIYPGGKLCWKVGDPQIPGP